MMTKEREKSGDVEKKKKDPRRNNVRVEIMSGAGIPGIPVVDSTGERFSIGEKITGEINPAKTRIFSFLVHFSFL